MSKTTRLPVPFVLVTGGKGGVGKTTVCANLGVQLAKSGLRVLMVDLDLGLANLDLVLGLESGSTLEDALEQGVALADCVQEGPGGVHVLPAGSGNERLGRLDAGRRARLVEALADLSLEYDLVVGDSAAGIGPDVLGFAAIADRVLLVTTPDLTALTDAYGVIKALDQLGARTGADIPTPEVIVNQSRDIEEGQAIARKLRAICERFLCRSPRQAGWIPRSKVVADSLARRAPFALGSVQALERLCLEQISGRLTRLAQPLEVAAQA
jgi:flagellar biosynthesis protein FlhG